MEAANENLIENGCIARNKMQRAKSITSNLLIFILHFAIILFSPQVSTAFEKPNILLITVDSFRHDHVGAYGYALPTTPNIDRIANEGIIFKNAITQGGWTSPAMISLFTSNYPSVHGVESRYDNFPCEKNSLIMKLREAGYQAPAALSANYFNLGFQRKKYHFSKLPVFKEWIEEYASPPFFLWYHINKVPHLPYNPKKPFDTMFFSDDFSLSPSAAKRLEIVKNKMIIKKGSLKFEKQDMIPIKALYDGEIRMADEIVHDIYSFFKNQGILDQTIMIITADHGDELLDHGLIGHASTNWGGQLYDEIIHVPLIIRYPPLSQQGKVIDEMVELIDIMPTIFEIIGIQGNRWIQGRSFLGLIQGRESSWKKYAFSETSLCGYQCKKDMSQSKARIVSLRSEYWKLIARHEPDSMTYELYNLEKDPNEKTNLINHRKQVAAQYKDILLNWNYKNRMLRKHLITDCMKSN
jgi:arylsulfatase A-like enzyme